MATLAAAEGSGQLCSFSLPQSTHTCRVTRTNVKCSTGPHTMGQIGRLRIWQNLTKSDRMRSGGEQNGRMTDTTRAHTHLFGTLSTVARMSSCRFLRVCGIGVGFWDSGTGISGIGSVPLFLRGVSIASLSRRTSSLSGSEHRSVRSAQRKGRVSSGRPSCSLPH